MTAYYVSKGSQVLGYNLHLTYVSHLRNAQKPTLESYGLMPENIYFCVKRALEIVYNFIFRLYSVLH